MSLIKFNNIDTPINAVLLMKPFNRLQVQFDEDNVPDKSILTNGFKELNEHNHFVQADFGDMNYIYRKIDDLTYVLTKDANDVYIEPKAIDENFVEYIQEVRIPTVEEVRNAKISTLSSICNKSIVDGVDIDIDGVTEHFSYNEEDQTNIKELFDLAIQTNMPMYYHSNGNSCKLYTVEQIAELYTTATINKMHHTTYYNQLKMYIKTLDNTEDINSVEYGFELIGKYLETYNAAMSQVKDGIDMLLK